VTHSATSHNQKQQHKQRKNKAQAAANRPREVVCTAPKTTINKEQNSDFVNAFIFVYAYYSVPDDEKALA
jgi:hypothetical protein